MTAAAVALATWDLVVGYGKQVVLEVDDLEIPAGQWWALVGPNGCGKTTLLDTVAGRHRALGGEVIIDGHSLTGSPRAARAQHADTALLIDRGRILARLDRDDLSAHRGHLGHRLAELSSISR